MPPERSCEPSPRLVREIPYGGTPSWLSVAGGRAPARARRRPRSSATGSAVGAPQRGVRLCAARSRGGRRCRGRSGPGRAGGRPRAAVASTTRRSRRPFADRPQATRSDEGDTGLDPGNGPDDEMVSRASGPLAPTSSPSSSSFRSDRLRPRSPARSTLGPCGIRADFAAQRPRSTKAATGEATVTCGQSIAAWLVDRRGGTIRVVDGDTLGARFEVLLPGNADDERSGPPRAAQRPHRGHGTMSLARSGNQPRGRPSRTAP